MTRGTLTTFVAATIAFAVVVSAGVQKGGVFTAQQAQAGKALFAETCAGCHMPDLSGKDDAPPLAGVNFVSSWGTRSSKDLLDYMSTAMPPGGPSLPVEEYASIAAYILQFNGAAAGTQALNASTILPIGSVVSPRLDIVP
jgi:mono/diheme cytochrome c family protein